MSAPDTNVERQRRHHMPSLLAIALSMLFGVAIGLAIAYTAIDRADTPPDGAVTTAPNDTEATQ